MTLPRPFLARALLVAATLAVSVTAPLLAQDGGPGTGGLVRQAQQRRYLAAPHRVLVIGAHPDDEDNELMTILSRGRGVETAYLALTRGEGGQNLIGDQLGTALGVLRSSELVAARGIDGGHQYFTRAIDFGFTTSAEESFRFWPHDSLLKDVVRVIRRFRPQVIVAVFSGTPRDGHGQHQVSGILAKEAFHAAADPGRFPELEREEHLAPFQPLKFYRDYGVTGGITLDGGVLDPATGHSLHQLAARARSNHRSQDMGALEEPGPSQVRIRLEEVAPGVAAGEGDSLFAGVPVLPAADSVHAAAVKLNEAGVVLDAYVDDDEVTPGQVLPVQVVVWNAGRDTIVTNAVPYRLLGMEGSTSHREDMCDIAAERVAPGQVTRCALGVVIDRDAVPSQPYYLRQPVDGAMYRWSGDPVDWGEPFEAPLRVQFHVTLASGEVVSAIVPVTARFRDQGIGEIRKPVTIMPRMLVSVTPGELLWPTGLASRVFTVEVEHATPDTTTARIALQVPEGWRVDSPKGARFTREGERATFAFTVHAPATPTPGTVTFRAMAVSGTDTAWTGAERIAYPHIRSRTIFHSSDVGVTVADVQFASGRRIGYVRGAADRIPEALRAAGVELRLLSAADLEGPVLGSLDVLVIGPRAYEIDDALRRAQPRLLHWTRDGGTLIIQYQQYQFVDGGFAPLPLTIGRPHDRVTDETAPMQFLPGSERLRTVPNRITAADFDGWVQERGLYFAHTWDPAWAPMLESHDAGKPPLEGGLLVGRLGNGRVVYTGLSFFRELPARVPGAWKLFANLLAVGQ